jgi:hypothetical protein
MIDKEMIEKIERRDDRDRMLGKAMRLDLNRPRMRLLAVNRKQVIKSENIECSRLWRNKCNKVQFEHDR